MNDNYEGKDGSLENDNNVTHHEYRVVRFSDKLGEKRTRICDVLFDGITPVSFFEIKILRNPEDNTISGSVMREAVSCIENKMLYEEDFRGYNGFRNDRESDRVVDSDNNDYICHNINNIDPISSDKICKLDAKKNSVSLLQSLLIILFVLILISDFKV